jgi:hypothetical protein
VRREWTDGPQDAPWSDTLYEEESEFRSEQPVVGTHRNEELQIAD